MCIYVYMYISLVVVRGGVKKGWGEARHPPIHSRTSPGVFDERTATNRACISKWDVQSVSEEGADMEKRDVRERRAKHEGTGQNIDEFGVPKWLVGCDVGVYQVTPP